MIELLEIFALAGGGGSSGGGGGGGGGFSGGGSSYHSSSGSSGGSSDPHVFFLFFSGFIFYAIINNWIRVTRRKPSYLFIFSFGLILAFVTYLISDLAYAIIIFFSAALGAFFATISSASVFMSKVRRKKIKLPDKSKDPAWDETGILQRQKQVFASFQNDWQEFNLESIKTYTTTKYYNHVYLMLLGLKQLGRINNVIDPKVNDSFVTDLHDETDNNNDTVEVYISASATDQLVDTKSGKDLYKNFVNFQEYWNFKRQGNSWLLDSISQQTADERMKNQSMEAFASSNNMYFSLDWGRMLLPSRGQLFNHASFKNSDVNNHVIGSWDNLLVQMYTYTPNTNQTNYGYYLIAQINMPKSYGGIIIKRKSKLKLFGGKPKGYEKVSFEWPDFNNRYEVFATDMDRVTSFELLNPKFMADLYDRDLKVEIEVVDNTVYMYSVLNQVNETRYGDMLEVLKQAFEELKR